MKIGLRTTTLIAAVAFAAVAVAPASAQHCGTRTECSPVMKQMMGEIGQAATEYWTPKLNEYKTRIDRALPASDLETLNRLRVRWAMLLDEQLAEVRTSAQAAHGKASVAMKVKGPERFSEIMEIFTTATEIASRNRDQVSGLQNNVLDDVASFLGTVSDRAATFADANANAISKDPDAKAIAAKRGDLDAIASDLRSEKSRKDFSMIYSMAVEPIIWLYNGADLGALLSQAGGIAKPIAGIEMPDASALKQNFPNPATTSTTITYTLNDASSATVVRLYDNRGTLVATYDQGAQGAGEHSLTVDVTDLASGSYLYHLSTQTPKGARVYSKTMQVVH